MAADVVQNIRLRIGADENVSPAFNSVNRKVSRMVDNIRQNLNQNIGGQIANSIGSKIQGITQSVSKSIGAAGNSASTAALATGLAAAGTAAGVATVAIGAVAVAVVAVGTAAAVATAGVLKLYDTVGEKMDATAKLADRLGATVEGLTSLQYNASLSGVAADQLSGGLEKMLATIGKAANGSGEASASLRSLGLNISSLARANSDEAFISIASAISQIPTAAGRAATTMEIFGKSGQSLLPIIAQGTNGIRAMGVEARAVGAVFSRFDAARVEAVNDAISRVGFRLDGYMRELAVGLAPVVQGIAEKVLEILPSIETVRLSIAVGMAVVREAAKVVAVLVDAQIATIRTMGVYWAVASNIAVGGIDLIAFSLVALANLIPGVNLKWTRLASDVTTAAQKANAAWGKVFSGEGARAMDKFFDSSFKNNTASATAAALRAANDRAMQARANMMEEGGGSDRLKSQIEKIKNEALEVGMSDVAKKLREIDQSAGSAADKGMAKFYLQLKETRTQAMDISKYLGELHKSIAIIGESEVTKAGRTALEKGGSHADAAAARIAARAKDTIGDVLKDIQIGGDPWAAWQKGLKVLDDLKNKGTILAPVFDSIRQSFGESLEARLKAIGETIRDAVKLPLDEAMAKMDAAAAALAAGQIDRATYDAYAKKLQEGLNDSNAAGRGITVKLASSESQGMRTGLQANTQERLAMLTATPLRQISASAQRLETYVKTIASKMQNGSGAQTITGR